MTPGNRILVTGATGFLGRHVVAGLLRSGFAVTTATRQLIEPAPPVRTFAINDISDHINWDPYLEDIGCIVHLAGRAHRRAQIQQRELDLYSKVNVAGTRHLAEAASKVGVRRFIYLSSIAVNGSTTSRRSSFKPTDPPDPQTPYGISKLQAEMALRKVHARALGLNIDIVRCPVVIGRDAPGNLALLAWALRKGIPLPFGSVQNRRAFLAVDDLTDFLALRVRSCAPGLNYFTLGSPDTVSTPKLIRLMATALGAHERLFPAPVWLIKSLLSVVNRRDKADALVENLEIDSGAAQSVGWQARVTIPEAIRRAFAR